MIGKKEPFIQIMRTTTFSSQIKEYADKVQISYDKMALPKISSQLKDLTNSVDSQIKVNSTIKSLDDNKLYDKLSNKLKDLCDLLDSKYSQRQFKQESNQKPILPVANPETKTEEPNPDVSNQDSTEIESTPVQNSEVKEENPSTA